MRDGGLLTPLQGDHPQLVREAIYYIRHRSPYHRRLFCHRLHYFCPTSSLNRKDLTWTLLRSQVSLGVVTETHQPVDDGIEVGLLLGTDAIAAHFAFFDTLQLESFDELIYRDDLRKI